MAYARYSGFDKGCFVQLCFDYNRASKNLPEQNAEFIILGVKIHAMRGRVPQRMRTSSFIKHCGTGELPG